MKLKHNKKRNTAFLYEVLIRHLTKSIFEKSDDKKSAISAIIKKHFRKGQALREELDIYRLLGSETNYNYMMAEKLMFEAKKAFGRIDKQQLFENQSAIIKDINMALGKDAYSVFIPNYKNLATLHQIFNDQTPIKTKVLLEQRVLERMCSRNIEAEDIMAPVDNIVYKTFVKKFNNEYGESLLEEQKVLLNKYIGSFSDNGMDLKLYLNEEVRRLRVLVEAALTNENLVVETSTVEKVNQVLEIIDNFKQQEVDREMVERILKIQSLVKEI
jgi:hypothetical protein